MVNDSFANLRGNSGEKISMGNLIDKGDGWVTLSMSIDLVWLHATALVELSITKLRGFTHELTDLYAGVVSESRFIPEYGTLDLRLTSERTGQVRVRGVVSRDQADESQLQFVFTTYPSDIREFRETIEKRMSKV